MLGFIAETEQIVATKLRAGNIPPAANNLAFFKACQAQLPAGVSVKYLRVDAAGYRRDLIRTCISQSIGFAIRAAMSPSLRQRIINLPEEVWMPHTDRQGCSRDDEQVTSIIHTMEFCDFAFKLVIQRRQKQGQQALALTDQSTEDDALEHNGFIYRAIATNRDDLPLSDLIHWYNQRGECAENRIKELKEDFAGNN